MNHNVAYIIFVIFLEGLAKKGILFTYDNIQS
jgi:hypothetical protein